MHHSHDPTRQSLAVTCYLDESATDGGSPTAVVGGLLINSSGLEMCDSDWTQMLAAFGLSALHMKDFGLHGKYARMESEKKAKIFARACEIIGKYKIYSVSATLQHADYIAAFSAHTRHGHSVYELNFIVAALGNGEMAAHNNYKDPIALIVDSGNPYAEHVLRAHREMETLSKEHGLPKNLGALAFKNDELISALQAADIICWGARRQETKARFPFELVPIQNIINDELTHQKIPIVRATLDELERHFQTRGKA